MKMWNIYLGLLVLSSCQLECTVSKTPATAKPVKLQLPTASPQAISNAQQEILSLKQQLTALENKNTDLKNLKKVKKELKNRFQVMQSVLQQQQQKNNPFFLELQATMKKKTLNPELKKKALEVRQTLSIDHKKLDDLQKNIHGIKTKILRIAPERKALLKKLHEAQKYLKELQLSSEMAKIKDRPA